MFSPLSNELCVWAGHTEAGKEPNGPPDSFSTELCVVGHTRVEGELDSPPKTALAPSSRVCPDPRIGSARSGPRQNGHEEH